MERCQRIIGHLHQEASVQSALASSQCGGGLMKAVGDRLPLIPLGPMIHTERHGGQLVAQVLKEHGVNFIFTLVGGHISPLLVASKNLGIRIIDVRHEVTAVFAADAVARITGVAGVAAVTAGPGITNTITAVKNAQMAQSPVVLLGGCAATMLKGRGALQDIDQMTLLKPIVKYAATCSRVRDIVPTLRRAFQEAMSGTPGPTFVELPLDVLYQMAEVQSSMGMSVRRRQKEVTEAELPRLMVPVEAIKDGLDAAGYLKTKQPEAPVFLRPQGIPGGLVGYYMRYKLASIFSGAWEDEDFGPLPVTYPLPAAADVNTVHQMLKNAKNPVLVVASQAMLHGEQGGANLKAAIETLGIPTFLGGMARGLLGRRSPYHIRQNRGAALKAADVIILAGAVCDFRMDYGRSLPSKAKVISINRDAEQGNLNSGIFWTPALSAKADPQRFVLALAAKKGYGTGRWDEWAAHLMKSQDKKEATNARKAQRNAKGKGELSSTNLVNPLALLFGLERVLPEDSILVADGGDFVATASYIVRPRGALKWLDPGAFGTLGVGGGFALGAKLCKPDSEVWLIWGDGSCGYSIAEYDTYKRHGVAVIGLVGNDAGWTQIEREQIPMFDDNVACALEYSRYDLVAQGYGGVGLEIKAGAEDELVPLLQKAQRLAAVGEPVLVNVHIGQTDFREGSLSV